MKLCYRSSVNRWECDENDHMNVRFYVAKHMEALQSFLGDAGVPPEPVSAAVRVHHIRFQAESRISAPISGYVGYVAQATSGRSVFFTELRQSVTNEVLSTCLHELVDTDLTAAVTQAEEVRVPEYGQPRGVSSTELERIAACQANHEDAGFRLIGRGVISAAETDSQDRLLLHNYMARLSDSMPHLWAAFGACGEDDSDGLEGGAVLEYRFHYHEPIRTEHRFGVFSGLLQAGAKVQSFGHLLFDETAGQLAVTAAAVSVRMDLQTRKAKTMTPDVLRQLQRLTIKIEE